MRFLTARRMLLAGLFVAAGVAIMLASSTTSGDHLTVYGATVKLWCIQAHKAGPEPPNFDKKISAELKSELYRVYKTKYRTYAITKVDSAVLTRGKGSPGRPDYEKGNKTIKWDIGLEQALTVTYRDHVDQTVNLEIQYGDKFDRVSIENGAYFFMLASPDPDPLIVVLQPTLIQHREP